jgi:hypothetical protein
MSLESCHHPSINKVPVGPPRCSYGPVTSCYGCCRVAVRLPATEIRRKSSAVKHTHEPIDNWLSRACLIVPRWPFHNKSAASDARGCIEQTFKKDRQVPAADFGSFDPSTMDEISEKQQSAARLLQLMWRARLVRAALWRRKKVALSQSSQRAHALVFASGTLFF